MNKQNTVGALKNIIKGNTVNYQFNSRSWISLGNFEKQGFK